MVAFRCRVVVLGSYLMLPLTTLSMNERSPQLSLVTCVPAQTVVIDSWRRNWEKLTTYFRYDKAVRKLIYTTNTIEGFHRQVRKVTKTKGAFTSDMALLKLIYLAHRNIKKKWTMPLANWAVTAQKLAVWFPGRMVLDLQ